MILPHSVGPSKALRQSPPSTKPGAGLVLKTFDAPGRRGQEAAPMCSGQHASSFWLCSKFE